MLPDMAPQDAYARLQALPFVETSGDGLIVHDAVQQAIAITVRAADPSRYRSYRRAAWRQLRNEIQTAGISEMWRYSADMLFMIENPVLREAFFPTVAHECVVEPATPDDGRAIQEIVRQNDGPRAAGLMELWWNHTPQFFSVARAPGGAVQGFYCMLHLDSISPMLVRQDPITWAFWQHLKREPIPKGQHVLVVRRWLDRELGDGASGVQAACFHDPKRAYMKGRPLLRRVYVTARSLKGFASALGDLCFIPMPEGDTELDGQTYYTAVQDFGPSSIDGWLARVAGMELGEVDGLLDLDNHELVIDGERTRLTPTEFKVMLYLYEREGKAVTRASLIENVWGYKYDGGSNVVEAIIGSLRRKLGRRSMMIETISGVGYRLFKGYANKSPDKLKGDQADSSLPRGSAQLHF
jgi:DNA-binding winged helix-turn-helix (wHTH) protein